MKRRGRRIPDVPIDRETLEAFTRRAFEKAGASAEDAATRAEVLVRASLHGVDSHGVQRVPRYLDFRGPDAEFPTVSQPPRLPCCNTRTTTLRPSCRRRSYRPGSPLSPSCPSPASVRRSITPGRPSFAPRLSMDPGVRSTPRSVVPARPLRAGSRSTSHSTTNRSHRPEGCPASRNAPPSAESPRDDVRNRRGADTAPRAGCRRSAIRSRRPTAARGSGSPRTSGRTAPSGRPPAPPSPGRPVGRHPGSRRRSAVPGRPGHSGWVGMPRATSPRAAWAGSTFTSTRRKSPTAPRFGRSRRAIGAEVLPVRRGACRTKQRSARIRRGNSPTSARSGDGTDGGRPGVPAFRCRSGA